MRQDLWEHKYKPQNFDDIILADDIKEKLKKALTECPNIMLIGPPGIGKGTWVEEYKRHTGYTFLRLNCSDETGIDVVREKIKPFAESMGFEDQLKIVYLNESDFLSDSAQAMLRDLMERVYSNTRFVYCCNYGEKMTSELKSRCQVIHMSNPPPREIFDHCSYILKCEKVRYKKKTLIDLIKKCYPDIRHTIITLRENVKNNVLPEKITVTSVNDVYKQILDNMLKSDPESVRKIIRSNHIDYTGLYKYLYNAIMDATESDVFYNDAEAIILIGEHSHRDGMSAVKEVNFMHMFFKMLTTGVIK